MDQLKTNFIPRGKFDKHIYKINYIIDPLVQSEEYLGNFKDNFSVIDDKQLNDINNSGPFMGNYTIKPLILPYSRQIYKPFTEDKPSYFKLGDPYIPNNGSNLNRNGDNHPIMPFNAIDLYKDDIYTKIKKLSMNQISRLNGNN